MNSFRPTNRSNPCPVCSDTTGDCRTTSGDTVLCLHATGDIPGWHYIGLSSNDLWGKFCPENNEWSRNKEEWEERKAQIERKKAQIEEVKRQTQIKSLTIQERNCQAIELLSQLHLKKEHKQNLLERGLTEEQIERGMFKSVTPFQKVQDINPYLAGIAASGEMMTNAFSGLICPVWHYSGNIVAWQYRYFGDESKYVWASSRATKRNSRNIDATAHLKDSQELPLSLIVANPEDKDLRLCEGFLKPYVAACRRNQNYLGAAGGMFGSSPQEFDRSLKHFKPEQIILCPDAGAIVNEKVMRQYRRLFKLCQKLGYSLFVEWWGQVDKEFHQDVDEINIREKTEIVSYLEWDKKYWDEEWKASGEPRNKKLFNWAKERRLEVETLKNIKVSDDLQESLYWAFYGSRSKKYKKKYSFSSWLEENNLLFNISPERYVKNFQKVFASTYENKKTFPWMPIPKTEQMFQLGYEPDRIMHSRRLRLLKSDIERPLACVKSAMSTGKTHQLVELSKGKTCLILCPTVALTESCAERFGGIAVHGEVKEIDWSANTIFCVTINSLYRVSLSIDFDLIFIDEADQLFDGLINGSHCRSNREENITHLIYRMQQSSVMLTDADLSWVTIWLASQICKVKPYIIHNTFKPKQDAIAYKINEYADVILFAKSQLKAGKRIIICSDSRTEVQKIQGAFKDIKSIEGFENIDNGVEIAEELIADFPEKNIKAIHGLNSGEPINRAFIKNINNSLERQPLDCLIYNSAMQQGVSIDVEAFDVVILVAKGNTLTHTALSQLIGRYRPDVEFAFYVENRAKQKKHLETNFYKLSQQKIRKNQLTSSLLRINPETKMLDLIDSHWNIASSYYEGRRNGSLKTIDNIFENYLKEQGHKIKPHYLYEEEPETFIGTLPVEERMKKFSAITKEADNQTIIKAPDLEEEEYEALRKKKTKNHKEIMTEKKNYMSRFWGLPVDQELLDKDGDGNLRKKVRRFESIVLHNSYTSQQDLRNRRASTFLHDLSHNLIQRKLLEDLNILDYIDPSKTYYESELEELGCSARSRANDIKLILGTTIYTPPVWLQRAESDAIKVSWSELPAKFVLTLANGMAEARRFESYDEIEAECAKLHPWLQLFVEGRAIALRVKATTMSNSACHAALIKELGLTRKPVGYSKEKGRGYRINIDSYEFLSQWMTYRATKRREQIQGKAVKRHELACRFKDLPLQQIQAEIEIEIERNMISSKPVLAYCGEISYTPPRSYINPVFLGGVYSSFGNLTIGDTVIISSPNGYKCQSKVLDIASGFSITYGTSYYLQTKEGWFPIEWVSNLNGLWVDIDPLEAPSHFNGVTNRLWAKRLLECSNRKAIDDWYALCGHAIAQSVMDYLSDSQVQQIMSRFIQMGYTPEWWNVDVKPEAPATEEYVATYSEPVVEVVAESTLPSDSHGGAGGRLASIKTGLGGQIHRPWNELYQKLEGVSVRIMELGVGLSNQAMAYIRAVEHNIYYQAIPLDWLC